MKIATLIVPVIVAMSLSAQDDLSQPQGVSAGRALGNQPSILLVRIIANGGWACMDGDHHSNTELGADLLFSANDRQRYGLRISSLDIDVSGKHQRYLCTGIVLDMVMFQWLRMEIGTVGYVGRDEISGNNPFGLVSFIGYEKRLGRLNLSIGYDSKVIFTKPAITINNLGVGFGLHF